MEKFCLYAFTKKDINKENMQWGVFVKSLGDYDCCIVVYHKCNDEHGVPLTNVLYMVVDGGVFFKANPPKFLQR